MQGQPWKGKSFGWPISMVDPKHMLPTSNFINLSIVELDDVTKQLLGRGLGFAPTTSSIPSLVVSNAMRRITTFVKVYSYLKDVPYTTKSSALYSERHPQLGRPCPPGGHHVPQLWMTLHS